MNLATAFIFDLNGTMIDDMEYHTRAWHYLINGELGKKMSWEDVRSHMYGKNSEVVTRIFGKGVFSPQEADRISEEKEKRYREEFLPHLRLLPGLFDFLQRASDHHIKMAIGSAAITANIDFVLDNLGIRQYFDAIVSADEVTFSKPDPETFLKAASLLDAEPASCLVFEDVPKGVESALNAQMQCLVLTTMHAPDEFRKYANVIATIQDYTDPFCNGLFQPALTEKS